ncbi:MAG TPA: cupin domain-containing protein [Solirubrobacterales bacterium]|nr:cupin domain-containing protein [Solirubrobacterales bacterium]
MAGIEVIKPLSAETGTAFVPPTEAYETVSAEWRETEYHSFRDPSDNVLGAYWEGEPGLVRLGTWPYDELCVLLSGRLALIDDDGNRVEFAAPQAFVIPRTFSGSWETIESTRKIFVAIK